MTRFNPNPNAERWSVNAGDAAIAKLVIPADLQRERRFEISCSMTVRPQANAAHPWHELRIFADGELQWARRTNTNNPSPFDGLDYRFSRTVGVGRALRLQAHADCHEARRLQLVIEAELC